MVQKLKPLPARHFNVGLTGGFGTGKTTVSGCFRELGAVVLDADQMAHEALSASSPLMPAINKLFENEKVQSEKGLDRAKIAAVIFKDLSKRKALETIIHPYVWQRFIEEAEKLSRNSILLLDVPLLFESGMHEACDQTIVVSAPRDQVVQRLENKGFSIAALEQRQAAQMPLNEKIKRAGLVIENSGSLDELKQKTEIIWKLLLDQVEKKTFNVERTKNFP